jgi:hypothetical protein
VRIVLLVLMGWAAYIQGSNVAPIQTLTVAPTAVVEVASGRAVDAFITHYTCEDDPENPMSNAEGMCVVTADGTSPFVPGVACPRAWTDAGVEVEVPGYGLLRCDDTGRYDYIDGLPHLDVRLVGEGAFDRALREGSYIDTIRVRE